MLSWLRWHVRTSPLSFGRPFCGRTPTLAKTCERGHRKGSSATGRFPTHYLLPPQSYKWPGERVKHEPPPNRITAEKPGVTPAGRRTPWPISARARLGQQCVLAHGPGGAPDNSSPPPPLHVPTNLPPSGPESPPTVGGRARHRSPGKGLVSCPVGCADKPFQTTSRPFTVPPPRWAKVLTGRLYLLSLVTETPLRHLLSRPLAMGGPGQVHTGRVGQTEAIICFQPCKNLP